MTDIKSQKILLRGLDQDTFSSFIDNADRTPYESYDALEAALVKVASRPRMLQKLLLLKPGTSHSESAMTTNATVQHQHGDGNSTRMDRVEQVLAALVNKQQPERNECFHFARNGNCAHGSQCRYAHTPNTSNHGDGRRTTTDQNNGNQVHNNWRHNGDRQPRTGRRGRERQPQDKMWCTLHTTNTHDTAQCRASSSNNLQAAPGRAGINAAMHDDIMDGINATMRNGFDTFLLTTRVSLPAKIFTLQGNSKLDLWCVDSGATTMATWDEASCFDIEQCNVAIDGPNINDTFFVTKKGKRRLLAANPDGTTTTIIAKDVLISESFPYNF